MKNRLKKRQLHARRKGTVRSIPMSVEARCWLDTVRVGREFGSKDYERLAKIDALLDAAKLNEIPPGEILLKEFIEPHGMTVEQFSTAIGWPLDRVTGFIRGADPVNDDFALSLGLFFNMDARFWINLQAEYDRRK